MVFDRFTFDSERRALLDGTRPIHLGPKAFRLLEILIANRPRALSKQELYEAIWQDTHVEESNLAGLINELRAALGDRARQPRFIRTVHGFGYAFSDDATGDDSPPAAGTLIFRGEHLTLQEGVNVLGREPSADVMIDDTTVSRKHAAITIRENSVTLEDLESKNGTFIDGVQLKGKTTLRDGQTFVLGDASIVFRRPGSVGSTVTMSRMKK